ncbi:MAG: hypothetical protein WD225_05620, partial [Ilumatobacteraceae bacterium]
MFNTFVLPGFGWLTGDGWLAQRGGEQPLATQPVGEREVERRPQGATSRSHGGRIGLRQVTGELVCGAVGVV